MMGHPDMQKIWIIGFFLLKIGYIGGLKWKNFYKQLIEAMYLFKYK
jgi:hypothetical protein